jgi:hypothetical protein
MLCIVLGMQSSSQDLPPQLQQQMEELADANEVENLEDDHQIQQLQYYKKHPLNINRASGEELKALYFLNELQVYHILKYRQLLGNFISIQELQAVPYLDLFTIKKMLPFISLKPDLKAGQQLWSGFKSGAHQIIFRWSSTLEKSRGFDKDLPVHFKGDRNHLLIQHRYQWGSKILYGMLGEKDAGEPFPTQKPGGFDFYSAHLFMRDVGKFKAIAIGDFTVNLGQGLLHWQSLAFGKGTQVMNFKRQSAVLAPYRSAGEYNFLRGIGMTYGSNRYVITAFASYRNLSANFDDGTESFGSVLTSGYHRTATEIEGKHALALFTTGGNFQLRNKHYNIGINTVHQQFSGNLSKRPLPYNFLLPSGNRFSFLSLDWSATLNNMHVFGEVAMNDSRRQALTSGLYMSVDPRVELGFLIRTISPHYYSLTGNAFMENSSVNNENGFFMGCNIRPVKGLTITASFDRFHFPWLKFRVDAPSNGNEYLVFLEYVPTKTTSFSVLYKVKEKPLNSGGDAFNAPVPVKKQSLRMHFSSQLNKLLHLRGRVEWVRWQEKLVEEGFSVYLESILKIFKIHSSLRLQFFETDGYNSRIYNFENDVLNSNSLYAAFDKGFRYYINLRYEPFSHLGIQVRFAQSLFKDKNIISSGVNSIQGNQKSDIRVQVVYSF